MRNTVVSEEFRKVFDSYWPKFFDLFSNAVGSSVKLYEGFGNIHNDHTFRVWYDHWYRFDEDCNEDYNYDY